MDFLERAELLIGQKRYDMAEEQLNKLLAEAPDHSLAIAYKALIKLNTRQAKQALLLAQNSLSLDPESDFALYIIAMAHMEMLDMKKAQEAIVRAIAIQPYFADYYGIHANIKLNMRDYKDAAELAKQGLQINPESMICRNVLSTAQLKLGDKEASFQTIEKALERDPENAMTHANYGWGQLEKGSHKKALEHFKEALAKDPEDEYARAGMLEALKAKFFLYRAFLKYYFWMSNLKPGVQWVVIIGFVFLQRVIGAMSRSSAELAAILLPLSYLLLVFVVTTWIIHPVFNFFMSLNRYAKYLLTQEAKNSAIVVGVAFTLFVLSVIGWFLSFSEGFAASAIVCFTLILPFGKIWDSPTKWVRGVFAAYSVVATIVGTLAVLEAFNRGLDNDYFFGYIVVMVAFTWISNFLAHK